MKKQYLKNEKGLTLVELLVSLAILSIVLALAYSLFFHNFQVFDRGEAQSEIQYEVRMVSDYITRELRNAKKVSLTNTDIDYDNKLDLDGFQERYSTINELDFSLENLNGRYYINYRILGKSSRRNNEYEIESRVLLNNIREATEGVGNEVYYEKFD